MLRLFISYCHRDRAYIDRFVSHLSPLRERGGLIDLWYDQDILAGDDFWERIEEHLADRDIVCLMLSANYLASPACKKEMEQAFVIMQQRSISIIPILLTDCGWKHFSEISSLNILPLEANPVASFSDQDVAWEQVISGIERKAKNILIKKSLIFKPDFEEYLDDASIFTKAHSAKSELHLSDIFIFPDLTLFKEDTTRSEKVSSYNVVNNFNSSTRLIIIGEDQSGKTALAKVITRKLREKNFIPVYIREDMLQGNIESKIESAFKEEYSTEYSISVFSKDDIIPIVDDFHKAKKREKILAYLSRFKSFVLVVDEAFDLDYTNNEEFIGIQRYRIQEFKPSFRNQLIKKWLMIPNQKTKDTAEEPDEFINKDYALIDNRSQMVEDFLGKAQSQGIMPSYPFFILTALVTIEDSERPLDESITSQGYCYQSLIYFFLREQGVSNDDIDSYINFLTEFAAALFSKGDELTEEEYHGFVAQYGKDYVLMQDLTVMERRLQRSRIIRVSSCKNYSFEYPYLYYFFAGKFFAEQFDNVYNGEDQQGEKGENVLGDIDSIFGNLHVSDNAYIAIFIAHHSKNKRLIERLLHTGKKLFERYEPASLSKEELAFFNTSPIMVLSNGSSNKSPEAVREERLKQRDELEERQAEEKPSYKSEDDDSELSKEIRRSIKTVEVIGRIIRNRTGSLRQSELSLMFKTGMNIHLRLITSFFDVINNPKERIATLNYIKNRIHSVKPEMDNDKIDAFAEKVFWNMNFGVILGFLGKITFSLGSDKLIPIINSVAESQDNEATFIIRQAITMYYKKNLQLGDIENMLNNPTVSEVSKRLMFCIMADYCQTHRIDYRDRSRLINMGFKPYQINPR